MDGNESFGLKRRENSIWNILLLYPRSPLIVEKRWMDGLFPQIVGSVTSLWPILYRSVCHYILKNSRFSSDKSSLGSPAYKHWHTQIGQEPRSTLTFQKPEVGIYTRKQESKKERKPAFDQESSQEKRKKKENTLSNRKATKKKDNDQEHKLSTKKTKTIQKKVLD